MLPATLGDRVGWAAERIGDWEARILLSHLTGYRPGNLFEHARESLPPDAAELLGTMVERRQAGEPLQYITGTQQFIWLDLEVGPGVLVPRPETELLVDESFELVEEVDNPVVVDAGTGSGAIALMWKAERRESRVFATDTSEEALNWARRNLMRYPKFPVTLCLGDLLSGLPVGLRGIVDLVISNPPYLSEREWSATPVDVRDHEPKEALTCGGDGFEATARLVDQSFDWLAAGGWLIFETSPALAQRAAESMSRFESVEVLDDLSGRQRIVKGRKP